MPTPLFIRFVCTHFRNDGFKICTLSVSLCNSRIRAFIKNICWLQGDQTSLRKSRPQYIPMHFLSKSSHNLHHGKKYPKNLGHFWKFQMNYLERTIAQ
jgi:hypothetical protein